MSSELCAELGDLIAAVQIKVDKNRIDTGADVEEAFKDTFTVENIVTQEKSVSMAINWVDIEDDRQVNDEIVEEVLENLD